MRRNKTALLFLSFAAVLLAAPVFAAETAVVTEGKVNVRGKPSFAGEVITQLERGDKVTVLERITSEKAKPGEPTNWAKIKLPANTPVWVFAPFVKDGKVSSTRLNLRAGPGENWSVVGRLNRGDAVNAIRTVTEWIEIAAPEDAYAFVDLGLLRFDGDTNAPAPVVAAAAPQPVPVPPATPEAQPAATPPEVAAPGTPSTNTVAAPTTEPSTERPAEAVAQPAAPGDKLETAPVILPATNVATVPEIAVPTPPPNRPEPLPTVAQPAPAKSEEALPKRIVRREGIIRPTKSIQAPTWFELANADTGKTMNYLYEAKLGQKLGLKLKDYRGKKVVVTGEEGIEPRWPNTPILDIETLDVLP